MNICCNFFHTLFIQIPGILAAVDATREQGIASRFGVRGYPTLKYFRFGETAFDAGSVRDAGRIIDLMKDPKEPPPPPPPDRPWSEEEGSEVVHLTDETFKSFLRKKRHVLVMFYAPCKYTILRSTSKFLLILDLCCRTIHVNK